MKTSELLKEVSGKDSTFKSILDRLQDIEADVVEMIADAKSRGVVGGQMKALGSAKVEISNVIQHIEQLGHAAMM